MPVIDRVLDAAATVIIRLVDYMQERRDRKVQQELPKLDPPLKKLSIDEAYARARADLEARRKAGK